MSETPTPQPLLTPDVPPTQKEAESVKRTAGQRKINLLWESTQAIVALVVTATTLYVAGVLALKDDTKTEAFLLLSNAFFVVISTYLTRTNHTKVGGVSIDGRPDETRRGE